VTLFLNPFVHDFYRGLYKDTFDNLRQKKFFCPNFYRGLDKDAFNNQNKKKTAPGPGSTFMSSQIADFNLFQ